jgi:F-type H+-transporting ATPase subunit a
VAGPIEQFQIKPLIRLGEIAGHEIALTNSSAFMFLTVGLAAGFVLLGSQKQALVPDRWQSAVELQHEFVLKTLKEITGEGGIRFFPLIFSLFVFILFANLIGMLPYAFTVTSHLIVTFALAALVFAVVTIYGLAKHGLRFFRLFWPKDIPLVLAPFIVPIEIISYLSRPVSHSVRLFAVMLGGHITLKVFAGFVVSLASIGAVGIAAAILPLLMTIAITALEFLMAFIQAYVFTMLSCMYLNDALHPGH